MDIDRYDALRDALDTVRGASDTLNAISVAVDGGFCAGPEQLRLLSRDLADAADAIGSALPEPSPRNECIIIDY